MSVAAAPKTLELISRNANYWLSLETNIDDYNGLGGMRLAKRGRKVQFSGGRATCPAAWRGEIEAHEFYGVDFWFADDAAVSMPEGGLMVVSGQVHANARKADQTEPPLPGWDDELAAREIRVALVEGRVADLQEALIWEGAHRARGQVLEALGKAIRDQNGAGDEDDPED